MTAAAADRKRLVAQTASVALALGLWLSPVPEGLAPAAWHLFALFAAAIASVVIGAFPILTARCLPRRRTPASRTARSS
jgi:divalent anion:Na+ symporter, DASS family